MPTIESLGHPVVFVAAERQNGEQNPLERVAVRTTVHSLDGMQKEALVRVGSGRIWRMVSDEGPYLNGADMAPFPLAFFSAGMQFSFLSHLVRGARRRSVVLQDVSATLDTFYSMSGSFLRGDAMGGAMPARIAVEIEADANPGVVGQLVGAAIRGSGPQVLMGGALTNLFALTHNGHRCTLDGLAPSISAAKKPPDFSAVSPDPRLPCLNDIILKTQEAETVHGVEGGAGSSLASEQKRTLHIQGEVRITEGSAMETAIRLIKPIGSSFRFLCDETKENGGDERAPSPLAYVSAGVGFCYMTQLGRYAHIRKTELSAYSLIQENTFLFGEASSEGDRPVTATPFDTHVFMESDETDDVAADFLRTGARTCFLHAAMREPHPSDVTLRLNGIQVPI